MKQNVDAIAEQFYDLSVVAKDEFPVFTTMILE